MPLPEEWDHTVDWRHNVVLLPQSTEGHLTIPINSQRFSQYPKGYFMMAYVDAFNQQVVGYNAADVGHGGKQVSEFVFWHELGHHHLGHARRLDADSMEVTFTSNPETAADEFSYNHWMRRRDEYGLEVVLAAIRYFDSLGNAPGDALHPPAMQRSMLLKQRLHGEQLCQIMIYNDEFTRREFVREVLMQCFSYDQAQAEQVISLIEKNGNQIITVKGTGRKARFIEKNEADKILHFIDVKKRCANQPAFMVHGHLRTLPA